MPNFGELPEVIRYSEPGTFDFWPFYYDHPTYTFKIGGVEHPIKGNETQEALVFPSGETLDAANLNSHPVLLNVMGRPITTPKFYEWISSCDYQDVFRETASVMREVYTSISEDYVPENDGNATYINFDTGFEREGHVHLQTFGNCACLGTDPDGVFVDYREWETGYAEYTLHNVDALGQYISLFAGLGHLATLAAAETA